MEAVAFVGEDERRDADAAIRFGVMTWSGDETANGVAQGERILLQEPFGAFGCLVRGRGEAGEILGKFDRLFDAEVLDSRADEVERLDGLPFVVTPAGAWAGVAAASWRARARARSGRSTATQRAVAAPMEAPPTMACIVPREFDER